MSSSAVALASDVRPQIWQEVRADCRAFLAKDGLVSVPIRAVGESPSLSSWENTKRSIPKTFTFWVDWYESMLVGEPQNWDMLEEIALLPNEDWDAGPERIAELIAGIEAKYQPKPKDDRDDPFFTPETARGPQSVSHLTENGIVTRMAADGLAQQITNVIEQYANDTGKNQLPDAFQALSDLPPVLQRIGQLAVSAEDAKAEHAKLVEEIGGLKAQIERLDADLREAKGKELKGVFSKSFAEQAGKSLGDWKMWGALLGGGAYLMGQPAFAQVLNSIGESIQEIFPHTAPPALPDISAVPPVISI